MSNYGFILTPATQEEINAGITERQRFSEAIFSYANRNKNQEFKDKTTHYFGNTLPEFAVPAHEHYWLGSALLSHSGCTDISQAYALYGVNMPKDKTTRQLTENLGKHVLTEASQSYDAAKAKIDAKNATLKKNCNGIINNTIKPHDLSPEDTQDFIDSFGLSPHDASLAAELVRVQSRTATDLITNPADAVSAFGSDTFNVSSKLNAAGELFKGNFARAFKTAYPETRKLFKKQAYQAGDQQKQREALLGKASDRYAVQQFASKLAYDAETQRMSDANGLQKFLMSADETAYSLYRGAQGITKALNLADASSDPRNAFRDMSGYAGEDRKKAMEKLPKSLRAVADREPITPTQLELQAQATGAAITSAKTQAREEADTSAITKGLQSVVELSPFFNPYTTILSVKDMASENAAASYLAVQSDLTGSIDPAYTPEIMRKAAFDAVVNWGTRAIPLKYGNKVAQAGLNKLAANAGRKTAFAIKNPVTTYAVNTGWTAANFATIVPATDAAARTAYETIADTDPRLRTGVNSLIRLQQDLQDPSYYATQLTVGAILGVQPTFQHYRASRTINNNALAKGLSKDEVAHETLRNTLQDRAEALEKKFGTKCKENPAQVINDALENTQDQLDEQEKEAAAKLGHSIVTDAAKQASLRRFGIDVTEHPDPDKIYVSMGGHVDPNTNKFVPGSKAVAMDKNIAAQYFGSIYDHNMRVFSSILREAMGKKVLKDALPKILDGKNILDYILSPITMRSVQETAARAKSARDKVAKSIRDNSKNKDGSFSVSEHDAISQANKTIDPTIDKLVPLGNLITFGDNLQSRIDYELNANQSLDPDTTFASRAFVLSVQDNLSPESVMRIFRITENASTREFTEEFGEQYLKYYMLHTGTDITDAWRTLNEVSKLIKDDSISLTTLSKRHSELAERLNKGLTTDGNLTPAELELIHRDVTEGFSTLLLSDLRAAAAAKDGSLPAWAEELFNARLLVDHIMQQELTAAAALNEARKLGPEVFNDAAKRLLNVTSDQVKAIFNNINAPKAPDYWDAYQEQRNAYEALLSDSITRTPEQADEWMHAHDTEAQYLDEELEQENIKKNQSVVEAIEEALTLPENKDKPREQVVKEVNERLINNRKDNLLETPGTKDDPASSNGKSLEKTDEAGREYRYAFVKIDSLSMMPNFKSGADKDTGEVNPLTGDYLSDHDPIRVLRRTDGSLMVMSGRHRLAHAKRYGMTDIAAFIYDETPEHNLAWAQFRDIQWNIYDNQATALDIALLIRGELIDGIPPLNTKDMELLGLINPRKGSQAQLGYQLGVNATPEVMVCLRNNQIDLKEAVAIAISSNDPAVQQKGLEAALNGANSRDIPTIMSIQQSKIDALKNQGDIFQTDFFNVIQTDTPYSRFVDAYALKQAKAINSIILGRNKAKQISTSKDAATILDNSGLQIDPNADPATVKAKILADQEKLAKWQKPYFHMDELRDQINKAFAKEHPEEWAKIQERQAQQEEKLMEAVDEALDLGNEVKGDVSDIPTLDFGADFSLSALHASGRHFLKFDTAFMGTGEGAQAYGWGLYFAENKVINKFYFDQFNKEHTTFKHKLGDIETSQEDFITTLQNIFKKNATANVTPHQLTKAIYTLMSGRFVSGWNIDNEINMLQKRVDAGKTQYEPLLNSLKDIKEAGIAVDIQREFATNYRVELNCSKDDFLSWDDPAPADLVAKAEELYAQKVGGQGTFSFFQKANKTLTGAKLYEQVLVPACGNAKEASMWLSRQGYKGIKHLDATSRKGKKNPTHNFIIFNNEDIKITAINRTGKWSMTEGWEPYTDTTADFSLFSSADGLQEWQLDPTAGLGSLGHFADQIVKKFASVGDDETDKRFAKFQEYLKRRQREFQNLHGKNDIDILIAELMHLPSIVEKLPRGYRFGLEPYIQFLTTYANLIKNADPDRAGKALPMYGWDEKMANSFRKMFARMLNEDMTGLEQMEFAELYSPLFALIDIQFLREKLDEAGEIAAEIFDTQHAGILIDSAQEAELSKQRKQAIEEAREQAMEENADIRDTMFRAVGQMRANRLVEKLLARVYLKVEQFRKDRTLAKISRALSSITPTISKNGKPVKGTVSKATYDKAVDMYRLLLLTKSQKEAVENDYPDIDKMEENDTLDVETFDHTGKPITLTVTKQEFETYACIEGMSADLAADTSKTLGTFIANGKQSWQLAAEAQNNAIKDFCNTIYKNYAEDYNQQTIRLHEEQSKNFSGKGVTKGIKRTLSLIYNDAQLIDIVASCPGLQHFRKLHDAVADAHEYLEKAQHDGNKAMLSTAFAIIGYDVKDPDKATNEQYTELRKFFNEIDDIKQLAKDGKGGIKLIKQAPDFEKQHKETARNQILKHIRSYTKLKNYNPHALAKVLEHLRDNNLMPADILNEVMAKYGKEGNVALYKGDMASAMEKVFPLERFSFLRDLNATIKKRTDSSMERWQFENATDPDKVKSMAKTSLSKRLADYIGTDKKVAQERRKAVSVALNLIKENLPKDIYTELINTYGDATQTIDLASIPDTNSYLENVLPKSSHGHLHDINTLITNAENRTDTSITLTELTRNEAAYRVLLCEQPDLADSLRKQGYTPEVIQQLKDLAGEQMMQFAYALRDLLGLRLPQLKAIYEATYGTPFPVVENYFRAFFDAGTKEANDSQLENIGYGVDGKSLGSMKVFYNRVKHNAKILPTMSVTHAFSLGMKQQDNIIAYTDPNTHQHIGEFMRRVLANRQGDTTMQNTLKAAIGNEHYDALVEHINNMYRLYGHANGFDAAANRGMRDIGTAASFALLTYSATSIAKNIMAFYNTLGGNDNIGPMQWHASAYRLVKGSARITIKEMMSQPFIRDRFKGWDTDSYLDFAMQQAGIKSAASGATRWAKRGMSVYGALDRYVTAASACVLYDATYRQLQKENPELSHDILHQESLQAAKRALTMKGQPMDWRQKPLTSTYNSWLTATYYFLGGEAWSTASNCVRLIAKSGFRTPQARKALANAAAVWLVHGFAYSCLNLAFNWLLDDEEHWRKRNIWTSLGFGTLAGPITGMPIVSNLAEAFVQTFDKNYNIPTPSYLPMADLANMRRDLFRIWDDKASAWDKTIAVSNTIRNAAMLALLGTTRSRSLTAAKIQAGAMVTAAANNAVNFFLRFMRNLDELKLSPVPAAPKKGVKMSQQSRKANKAARKNNADDYFPNPLE